MSRYNELNLDTIVDEWASDMYQDTKKPYKDQVDFKKDYSRIKFIDDRPQFEPKFVQTNGSHPSEILYEETYTNNTDRQQTFSLKLTRKTVSVGRIDLSKAMVMNDKTRFRMRDLPDGVPVTAGFGSEINFQDIGLHEMKESLSWTVDTQVKVASHSRAKAIMTVTEKTHESNFLVNTRIRGNVHCDVFNHQTGKFIKSIDGDIVAVLDEYANNTPGLTIHKNQASFQSSGYCSLRFGIEKHVSLEEEEFDDE